MLALLSLFVYYIGLVLAAHTGQKGYTKFSSVTVNYAGTWHMIYMYII